MLRRLSHASMGGIVVIYLFPTRIFSLPRGLYVFVLLSLLPGLIEYIRLKKAFFFLGLREHEKRRAASYLWFTNAVALTVIFFPQQIAVPVIIAGSLTDPVIGELRRLSRFLPSLIGLALSTTVYLLFGYPIYLALTGGIFTLLGEALEVKGQVNLRQDRRIVKNIYKLDFVTDDDFTIILLPAIILLTIYFFSPFVFPAPILHPVKPFTILP